MLNIAWQLKEAKSTHNGAVPRNVRRTTLAIEQNPDFGAPRVASEAEILLLVTSKPFDPRTGRLVMNGVQGFCLKCKTYGPIKDGKEVKMANGRVRVAGFCSESGCTGKISKIVR